MPVTDGFRSGAGCCQRVGRVLGVVLSVAVALGACSDDDGGSAAELCGALGDRRSFASTFEGFDPTDARGAVARLRDARVELGALRDAAPGELHDEIDVEIEGVQTLLDALEELGADAEAAEAVAAVRAQRDELAGVDEATAALDRWYGANCRGGASGSTTSTADG